MNTFLTRISARAKRVLDAFGDNETISLENLISKIIAVDGMGARIVKEYSDIECFLPTQPLIISQLLEEAFYNAVKMNHTYVGTEHLLLAALIKTNYKKVTTVSKEVEKINSLSVLLRNMKENNKGVYLSTHSVELTKKYNFSSEVDLIDRAELDKIFTILLQRHNPNVLLVGEEGAGKESLTEALAKKIAYMESPRDFMGAYVLEFSFSSFIAAAPSAVIGFELVLKDLANEVFALGNVIIVIKHLPSLVPTAAFKQFVEFLNAAGARFVVCVDGELESTELFSAFTVVEVEESSQQVTLDILQLEAQKLEKFYVTRISHDILDYIYARAKTEIKDQVFPQKGISLLDRACSMVAFEETRVSESLKKLMDQHLVLDKKLGKLIADKKYDAAVQVSGSLKRLSARVRRTIKTTDLAVRPLTKADVDRALKDYKGNEGGKEYKIGTRTLMDLEERLKKKVIGQEKAVQVVAKALVRSQMGLRPKNKPVGNFLFLGPTGVGKTELARVLAQEAFGEGSLIRLDMSDFSEKHTVARLVGAPPGYIGYNEGGELTTKIARRPQSVVLFDEIEKAHPEVMNILLQIMEEGQLSDMRGDLYDFSKAVIILTSNLGTDTIHKRDIGYGGNKKSSAEIEEQVMRSAKSFIKPELLNRFDEIIAFRQLEKADSVKILDLLLKEVYASLKEKGIRFKADLKTKEFLLNKGFSTEFGARALRRTVEKELLDKIAAFLLDMGSRVQDGQVIHVVVENEGLSVKN